MRVARTVKCVFSDAFIFRTAAYFFFLFNCSCLVSVAATVPPDAVVIAVDDDGDLAIFIHTNVSIVGVVCLTDFVF